MNQSEFLAITCNALEAREKSRVRGTIGFGFTSHWLKNWRESFKPITKRINSNHLITFDGHLKTAIAISVVFAFGVPYRPHTLPWFMHLLICAVVARVLYSGMDLDLYRLLPNDPPVS